MTNKNNPPPMTKWYERINWLAETTDTKRSKLAEVAGVGRANVTNWLAGASESVDAVKLLAMCDHLGASFRWVATGEGQPFESSCEFHTIPCLNGEAVFAMAADKRFTNWKVENERSFEPRIKEGDWLFIDHGNKELTSTRLYLFRDKESGQMLLRRYYMNLLEKTCGLLDGLADDKRPDSFRLYSKDEFDQILERFDIVGQIHSCYTARI